MRVRSLLVANGKPAGGSNPNSTLGVGDLSGAPEVTRRDKSVEPSSRRVDESVADAAVPARDALGVYTGKQGQDEKQESERVACDGLVGDSDPNSTVWVDGL